MFKILKNLKRTWVAVLAIIILLCVQAATDLALPDFTSKIVNNGIQSGGIESAVPSVISKADMENLLFFAEDDEQILENYELVGADMSSYQKRIINKFFGRDSLVEANTIYVVKDLNDEQLNNLEDLMSSPLLEYSAVSNEETASQIKTMLKEQMSSGLQKNSSESSNSIVNHVREQQKFMLESVEKMSVIDLLKQIPEDDREQVLSQFTEYIEKMSESIKEQAAESSVKQFYVHVGVDTAKIQNDYILIS